MDRMTGRAAVTSHCGSGSTVLRASDRPACRRRRPVYLAGRRGQTGRPYVLCLSRAGDIGPVDGATDTVTGAEAQSLPPPDAKGSGWVDEPPIIKSRLVVATLPSSHFSKARRFGGRGDGETCPTVSEGDFRGNDECGRCYAAPAL